MFFMNKINTTLYRFSNTLHVSFWNSVSYWSHNAQSRHHFSLYTFVLWCDVMWGPYIMSHMKYSFLFSSVASCSAGSPRRAASAVAANSVPLASLVWYVPLCWYMYRKTTATRRSRTRTTTAMTTSTHRQRMRLYNVSVYTVIGHLVQDMWIYTRKAYLTW